MKNISYRTNKGKGSIQYPESWDETNVDQFQRLIRQTSVYGNDGSAPGDWIPMFSILSGIEADTIAESKDGKMETALYESIQFVLSKYDWDKIPIPAELTLRPIWSKDAPLNIPRVKIPREIGRLSIGQTIQARTSLADMVDLREGLSIVTAIYLQPLIDGGKFDMLRAIEIEQIILKCRITEIYPVGFFLLKKLKQPGSWLKNVWNLLKLLISKKGKRLLN
jgi:hypothetical protein